MNTFRFLPILRIICIVQSRRSVAGMSSKLGVLLTNQHNLCSTAYCNECPVWIESTCYAGTVRKWRRCFTKEPLRGASKQETI